MALRPQHDSLKPKTKRLLKIQYALNTNLVICTKKRYFCYEEKHYLSISYSYNRDIHNKNVIVSYIYIIVKVADQSNCNQQITYR